MTRSIIAASVLFLFATGTAAPAADPFATAPASTPGISRPAPSSDDFCDASAHTPAVTAAPAVKNALPVPSDRYPKVVFQTNQAADAPTILRFVTNYLIAEPNAAVVVVGYGGGADFMLKGARDPAGKPYADQLQALADKGVSFRVCNNTLKARNLTADAVASPAIVVTGAVNEIIRLQTREGYAYFRH